MMLIGNDGGRICRYLVGISPHRAFHITGIGVSILCDTALTSDLTEPTDMRSYRRFQSRRGKIAQRSMAWTPKKNLRLFPAVPNLKLAPGTQCCFQEYGELSRGTILLGYRNAAETRIRYADARAASPTL